MNQTKNTEKLQLTFSCESFGDEEIEELQDAFAQIDPVDNPRYYARESADVLPAWLLIALGFIGGAVATGFFNAIGTDAYSKVKEKVQSILKTKKDPTISFAMNYKDVEININCKAKDEATISKVFDTIRDARDLAIRTIDDPNNPTITHLDMVYENDRFAIFQARDLRPTATPKSLKWYAYDKDNKKWAVIGDLSNY